MTRVYRTRQLGWKIEAKQLGGNDQGGNVLEVKCLVTFHIHCVNLHEWCILSLLMSRRYFGINLAEQINIFGTLKSDREHFFIDLL